LALDGGLGVEAVGDLFRESFIGVHVFGREHDDACGETVAESVDVGTDPALRRGGSWGKQCVEFVGCVLSWRRHVFLDLPVRL